MIMFVVFLRDKQPREYYPQLGEPTRMSINCIIIMHVDEESFAVIKPILVVNNSKGYIDSYSP